MRLTDGCKAEGHGVPDLTGFAVPSFLYEVNMLSEYILIGEVVRPQGIKGLVKVRPHTDDPYRFETLEQVYIEKNGQYTPVPVDDVSVHDEEIFLRLGGTQDRNCAERQRGWLLYVDRAHAVALRENENFICDLIGCEVRDTQGAFIGKVTDVMQPGGNDVYEIRTKDKTLLVPALKKVFPEVDVQNRLIICDEHVLPQVSVEMQDED